MNSRVHYLVGISVALAGVLLSLAAFLLIERASEHDRRDALRSQAFERMLQIERTIQADMTALRAFRGLFNASQSVDREEFRRFREAINLAPSVFALTWAPRVAAEARADFERLAQAEISADFRIWEFGDDASPAPLASRTEYFPVLYNERSAPGSRPIIGFDVASIELRKQAIEAARLTGEMVATPPMRLMTSFATDPTGFLVIAPVFEGQGLPSLMQRLDRTRGLVIGVFEISQFVRQALGPMAYSGSGLTVRIFDRTDANDVHPIFVSGDSAQTSDQSLDRHHVLAQRIFDVAGRKWDVMVSIEQIPGQFQHWSPWIALMAGLILTAALVAVLHLAQGRRDYAERVAEERTEELVRVADRLNAEISDRTSIERELLRSRERLQDSIESLDDGFALYDSDYRLKLWNSKYQDYDQEVADRIVPGVTFETLAQAGIERDQWLEPQDLATCRPGSLSLPSVRERQLRDGRWLLVKLQGTSEGGLVDIRTDITHLKTRAVELEDHRDRLEKVAAERTRELEDQAVQLMESLAKEREYNALQGEFVSMVSHEFRTPLAIIDGAAQRIERKAGELLPEELITRIGKIRNAVRRLVSLIDSTLSFSRIEAGRVEANLCEIDIEALLVEVCEQQQQLATGHRIDFSPEQLPSRLEGDLELLRQVFSNLLSNAVKYSPGADRVEVRATVKGDQIRVSVRDFGLGIPEDDLPRLFDRFYRASNVTGIAGTGIGLNLCRSLLELHGGTIDVQSVQGEGSLFTARIPLRADNRAFSEGDPDLGVAEAS